MTNFPSGDPLYPHAGAYPSYGEPPYGSPYASPYGQPHGAQYPTRPYAHPDAYRPAAYPPSAPRPRVASRLLAGFVAALVAVLVVAGAVALSGAGNGTITGSGSNVLPASPGNGSSGGGSGSGGTSNRTPASADRQTGIVTIVSVLRYQQAESAGTGMIISPDGEILTNNHVINGSTSITVTVQKTGRTYRADVVGTAPTEDVAVIKLRNASGLQTASLATSSSGLQLGDNVVAVGNAGGQGRLQTARGSVTALGQSITASDENGQDSERLHDLIETDAPIISGDSGGPLYDSAGKIVGMTTAASTSNSTTKAAYAIPIENARSVASRIESGVQTTTIHIGLPGFLGITSRQGNGGVSVQDVVSGGPADTAGIEPGSLITAVDGTAITSPVQLRALLTQKNPGDRVTVTWTGLDGASHRASVRLATGPAD